jgi:hypothetical protein
MARPRLDATPNVKEGDLSTVVATKEETLPGIEYTPRRSLEGEAAQRAAMAEWERRRKPGQYATLANGQMVEVRGSVISKYPGAKKTMLMAKPEAIIDPRFRKPDYAANMPRYQWRCRTDTSSARRDLETAALHRRGDIRYVEIGEIDKQSPYALIEEYAVPGPGNNVYVIMDSNILCEILNPNHSYEKYGYWEDLAISNVSSLPEIVMSYGDTHVEGLSETSVVQKAIRQGS